MDYSALCSFSISLTLPSSCSFHSNMVVLKGVERSRERRYTGDWWLIAMPRGVKTGLMKSAHLLGLGGVGSCWNSATWVVARHVSTLENKSRNQS